MEYESIYFLEWIQTWGFSNILILMLRWAYGTINVITQAQSAQNTGPYIAGQIAHGEHTDWDFYIEINDWYVLMGATSACITHSIVIHALHSHVCLSLCIWCLEHVVFFNQVLIFKNRSLGLINQPLIKISVEDKSQFSELFFFLKNHKFITRCSIAVRNKVLGILQYTVQNYKEKPNQRCETKTRSLATEPDTREVRKGGERKGKKKQE